MKIHYQKIEELLEVLCAQNIIGEWYELTKGQYRLNGELDIFPRHQKYFYVPTKERGNYKDLEDFIRTIYI